MMLEQLSLPLQITLVGMGLVFAAIILLWGVMALLVRLAGEGQSASSQEDAEDRMDLKVRAASAAVAAALAIEKAREEAGEQHEFPLPPTAIVSAWQSVMRANMLSKKGHVR
jgi:Na+-transporting methylmalonyl-CoA/oxaloacetate decarboxylase gamma subunit